jgi:hypothetical protein
MRGVNSVSGATSGTLMLAAPDAVQQADWKNTT